MALCGSDTCMPQARIRKRTLNHVDRQLFPTALREVRAEITQRNAIVAMIAIGLILGLSGPFDTLRLLTVGPRTLYWLIVVVLTYGIGSFISTLSNAVFRDKPLWLHLGVSTICIGTAVSLILIGLNALAFNFWPTNLPELVTHWGFVTLISGVIEVGAKLIRPPDTDTAIPLLDRLPFAKRGALVALSAEDHYVNVCTTKGHEMLLMRLSDAIKEVGSTAGLQIHRSHWVATDQIADVRRINDRGEITLSTGHVRPVSRGYMAAVRDAGLLPRGRNG